MRIRWWWGLFLVPILAGLARLHFDTEVLDLLPADVPAVQGLKIYQQHFSNARELLITIQGPDAETTSGFAHALADNLSRQTNLASSVFWQPPWQEHPEQTAELIGYLWLNQPPDVFRAFAQKLSPTNAPALLDEARQRLSTTLSPDEIAQLSYDPFGFTRLPEKPAAMEFSARNSFFSSADGTFRVIFVRAGEDLTDYEACQRWLKDVDHWIEVVRQKPGFENVSVGYTGRPAFVAEISAGMRHDITLSVLGTSVIIAVLFWLAHRRVRPMLWLLTLLALILVTTLALGGLFFGVVNVISMGFAAILLGLAVDYAVVHYQEALAHPDRSIPQVRRAIAPAIFWAAVTTISAFLVLNFGGLPGLAQLGSLVAIGVILAALVMIFAYLPPLFPERMKASAAAENPAPASMPPAGPVRTRMAFGVTVVLVAACAIILRPGLPGMEKGGGALQMRDSRAMASLNAIKANLNQQREPLCLVVAGTNETEVARKLDAIEPVLAKALSEGALAGFDLPTMLWPHPGFQQTNRLIAAEVLRQKDALRQAAVAGGFEETSLGLADGVFRTWQRAGATTGVFWPTNAFCDWILERVAARDTNELFAAAFLYPSAGATESTFAGLESQWAGKEIWLSGWERIGGTVLARVTGNLWKLVLPMAGLVLLSLWLAFRRWTEIALSVSILLLSGWCLLAVMRLAGWHWNLMNLMALPLILGTGVDYSIFMQLALRRYHGDLKMAYNAVGRALLLCGGTAIAGFGSLGFSSNAGMAGLGRVCAVGIAGNMLISVFLLPIWWKFFAGNQSPKSSAASPSPSPSRFYGADIWRLGLKLARIVPGPFFYAVIRAGALVYWRLAPVRREIVVQNLLPVMGGDRRRAEIAARELFKQFGVKIGDLLRFEGGLTETKWFTGWQGWEHFNAAHGRGKGVLLVTPHLGNWEFGGAFLVEHGFKLLVLTQPEPDEQLTALRQDSRARRGVETLVVADQDAFAFIEIIKRLQAGAIVALLVDRPPARTAVTVDLFGRDFPASIAAAELARASGCAILPSYIVRAADGYRAQILPEIVYDRAGIGQREQRIRLTREILRAFEPVIRENATQWYHFVPVWPVDK